MTGQGRARGDAAVRDNFPRGDGRAAADQQIA
jgi:hypothetical protein